MRAVIAVVTLASVAGLGAAPLRVDLVEPSGASYPAPTVFVPCERREVPFGGKSETFAEDLARRGYRVAVLEVGSGPFKTKAAVAGIVSSVSQAVTRVLADRRTDRARVGMAGYAKVGGLVSFYAGLTDSRIRAVVTGSFGYGGNLWNGLDDAGVVRAAGDKPVFFLIGNRDGDRSRIYAAMKDRSVCRDSLRRWFVWRLKDALERHTVDEVFSFADIYVRGGGTIQPRYAHGWKRLLDRNTRIGGKNCRVVRIPAVVTAPDGTVVLVADARFWNYGDLTDCQPTRTVIRRSKDSGRTWSEPELTAEMPWNESEKMSMSDPSLVVDRQAKKLFLFVNGMEFVRGCDETRQFVQESADNGRTWSRPRDITAEVCWPGIVNGKSLSFISSGHGVQAPDGTLLHVKVSQRFGVHLFGSDDHGRTWKTIGKPTMKRPDESKIEVLADGTWIVNSRDSWLRTNHRSKDRGMTWVSTTEPQLPDSITNGSILRVPRKNGEVLLISNSCRAARPRTNIKVRASRDGGHTWNEGVLIDPKECGYSDMTLLPDGRIGVVYEADGENSIDFVSVSLDEILATPARTGKEG